MISVPVKNIAADPVFGYHLLGYYYRHSASRAELGTQTGLDGVQARRDVLLNPARRRLGRLAKVRNS